MNQLLGYWLSPEGSVISENKIVEMLATPGLTGIYVFDGISGCGKSRILRKLRDHCPEAYFCSYESVTRVLIALCQKRLHSGECMAALFQAHPILGIEDVDYWAGKTNTMEIIAWAIRRAADTSLIILNGNQLQLMVPELLEQLDHRMFKCCSDKL